MKTFTKIALILAALIAIPFLVELIISSYDIATNPWTLPNSVVAEGGFVREGANRREFREPRFRARGLQFYFLATDLSPAEADSLAETVTGKVTFSREGGETGSYDFRLAPQLRKEIGSVGIEDKGERAGELKLLDKTLVEGHIVPASKADEAEAARLAGFELELGETVDLTFKFEGQLPLSSSLKFSYSKAPDSILHGTFLGDFLDSIIHR